MRAEAIVESVRENNCVVLVKRGSACGDNCKNCSAGCKNTMTRVVVKNPLNAMAGDLVLIETDSKKILKIAFLVYIVPLLLFFTGYIISGIFSDNEAVSILISVIIFLASFLISKVYDSKNKGKIDSEVIQILKREE